MSFDDLVVDNLGWLKRVANRLVRNPEMAEDIVGDAVYKILRNKDKYNPEKDFKPWALTILTNTYITYYNRRKCLQFSDIVEASDAIASNRSSSRVDCRDISAALRRCASMSVCIECLVLYARGYSYIEISELLGIGIGTVKSRIATGRKLLKDELEL